MTNQRLMTFQSPNLAPVDGNLYLLRQFYPHEQAEQLFQQLLHELLWQEEQIFIYGRRVKVPRLMCWYGDAGANYQYSHVLHQPMPWTNTLTDIKRDIEKLDSYQFNSVLGNLYRNGQDSIGRHADNEPELGGNPIIASLSLGDSRLLKFKHQTEKVTLDLLLEHGDLLIMTGTLQQHWLHQLPKTRQSKSARINLTFRKILLTSEQQN